MAKVKHVKYEHDGKVYQDQWHYQCPGCGYIHALSPKIHTFNGDFDKPTFRPSVLYKPPMKQCHAFITDGMIQFLSDCDHSLAGQTVELPELTGNEK
jgi:hypothetical protein